jgi:hypothetical protein
VLVCMNDLAIAERRRGDHGAALTWVQAATEGLEAALGPDHPYTLSALMNLAICLTDVNRTAQARTLLAGKIDAIRHTFGHDHPNTLRAEANLALMDRALGDAQADIRLATLRERLVNRLGGERHPIVAGLQRRSYLYRLIDPHQF